jgi:hypothetical protein
VARRTRPLERTIEAAGTRYGKSLGFLSRKMNGLGFRSWPDRMYVGPGVVFFLEYKRLGEEPTPLQAWMHGVLRSAGLRVYVPDTAEDAKKILLTEAKRIGLPKLKQWEVEMRASFKKNPLLMAILAREMTT